MIMAPIKQGFYSYVDLNDMYIEDVLMIVKYMSFDSDISTAVEDYYRAKAELENS